MQSNQNLDSMKRKDLKDHLPEPREKFSIKLDEVLKVKRIIHSRVKYVSKNDFDDKINPDLAGNMTKSIIDSYDILK